MQQPAAFADGVPPGFCPADRPAVFACDVGRGKAIAICAHLPSEVQYRFGTAGHGELIYPMQAEEGLKLLRFADYRRAQVTRLTVSFDIGEFSYTVFDGWEEGRRSAGVSVQRNQGRETTLNCRSQPHGSLAPLKAHLACDTESALNLGGCR
jgi:hypothetical protein